MACLCAAWCDTCEAYRAGFLAMAERLVLALCCLLPEFWWIPAAAAWSGAMFAMRVRRMLDLSWLGYYVGSGAALTFGLAARWVYYY